MSLHATQATLLTMGLDAATAHPELVVNTKTGFNTMKRRFDTVAARRAFGRSDILAQAHLSKAMSRLAQKGIYLPMSKEMLQGEIKATAGITKLEEDDDAVGRLSLTPMGEFSYQRKEIAEGEDLKANIPSYDYNQGVLTKLKKRVHRMGKRHPSQSKGDVKSVLKEKEALEDEYSKIIDEMIQSNYYVDNLDSEETESSDGGGGGGGGNDPFHPPHNPPQGWFGNGHFFVPPPLNLGGNVGLGGMGPPPHGNGGDGPGAGGGGPGGNPVMQMGNTQFFNPMVINPNQGNAQNAAGYGMFAALPPTPPASDAGSVRSNVSMGSASSASSTQSHVQGQVLTHPLLEDTESERSSGSRRSSANTMARVSAAAQAAREAGVFEGMRNFLNRLGIGGSLPQQTTGSTINASGKQAGQPTNLNNTTNTTINMTNNGEANESQRSSRNLATPKHVAIEERLVQEAVDTANNTRTHQEINPPSVGRGLVAENTTQRVNNANTGPEAVPPQPGKRNIVSGFDYRGFESEGTAIDITGDFGTNDFGSKEFNFNKNYYSEVLPTSKSGSRNLDHVSEQFRVLPTSPEFLKEFKETKIKPILMEETLLAADETYISSYGMILRDENLHANFENTPANLVHNLVKESLAGPEANSVVPLQQMFEITKATPEEKNLYHNVLSSFINNLLVSLAEYEGAVDPEIRHQQYEFMEKTHHEALAYIMSSMGVYMREGEQILKKLIKNAKTVIEFETKASLKNSNFKKKVNQRLHRYSQQ